MNTMTGFRVQDHFLFISYNNKTERISFKNAGCWVKQHHTNRNSRWIPRDPENLWDPRVPAGLAEKRDSLISDLPGRIRFIVDLFPESLRWTVLKRLSPWHDELSLKTFFKALHENPVLFMSLLTADSIKSDLEEGYFSPLLFLMDKEDQLAVLGLPGSRTVVHILKGIRAEDFSIELLRQIRMDTLINNKHADPGYRYNSGIIRPVCKKKTSGITTAMPAAV